MIVGIGIDLTLVGRIENLMLKFGKKFISKIFTKYEISCANQKKSLALKSMFYA